MNKLAKKVLLSYLSKPCPRSPPRTGKSAKNVDCYSLVLIEEGSPKLSVLSLSDSGYEGNFWDGDSFKHKASIPFQLAEGLDLRIEHFHGIITATYNGVFESVIYEWTKLHILKYQFELAKHHVPQFFFNRKRLQLPQRMELLEKIIEHQVSEPGRPITGIAMMTYLHSSRWHFHPNKSLIQRKMNFYLRSFCASGELIDRSGTSNYEMTGQAISTLEQYQIETQRAKDAKSTQKWMLKLTILLAFFASVQSGLIKSPIWFDLAELFRWIESLVT